MAGATNLDAATIVLVEGVSDRAAVEALANRRGRNLATEGVEVIPIGGAQAVGNVLTLLRMQARDVRLAGLCDVGEELEFRRGLERVGLGSALTRDDMEGLGFFVCVEDLEDELVRALGSSRVEQVLEERADLASFRTFQKQPQWRSRSRESQLRRFLGQRKIEYAPLLVDALDPERVPRPLDALLAAI